jgi:acyl carrier protein
MVTMPEIEALVFRAIDRTNELLPDGSAIEKTRNEPLADHGTVLDSMGIVNLVAALEDELAQHFHAEMNLAEARAEAASDPLATVGSLIRFLSMLLGRPE